MRIGKSLACAALVLALATPPAALAAPQHVEGPAHSLVSDSLIGRVSGTNGYVLHVYGYRKQVAVSASLVGSSTTYVAHGVVTDTRLTADFGQFGSLDLTFERHGKARHPHFHQPSGCRATYTIQPGVLRGAMTFHARDEVTAVDATEIDARYAQTRVHCEDEPGHIGGGHTTHGGNGHHVVFLDVSNSRGDYGTNFDAMQIANRRTAIFSADVAELIDGVDVYSSINIQAPKDAFTYDVRASRASVEAPAPFSGSAQLARGPNGVPTWTGDLTVDLPGYGATPLTGPGFQANLATGSVIQAGSGGWFRPLG